MMMVLMGPQPYIEHPSYKEDLERTMMNDENHELERERRRRTWKTDTAEHSKKKKKKKKTSPHLSTLA